MIYIVPSCQLVLY